MGHIGALFGSSPHTLAFIRYLCAHAFGTLYILTRPTKGHLDLMGRHQSRYDSFLPRYKQFTADLAEVRAHDTVVEEPIMHRGKIMTYRDGRQATTTHHNVNPPNILESFEQRWRLKHACDLTEYYSLYGLFALSCCEKRIDTTSISVDQIPEILKKYPEPKFQVRRLLDLPPELLHYIMDVADPEVARNLGATCRMLRRLSLWYSYRVSYISSTFNGMLLI